ncbi:MAG: hypothetical protein QOG13_3035 [Sphingomonadales bacterium]|nr:hypothetical protein [Sphingomonadales bacterium]MEA3045096.1 hypothetical protein [Sphingomonadales bacterium]
MAQTTQIDVTKCDNELYVIASTPAGSSEILHIKSGYNKPVNHTIYPPAILPPGNYTLILVGINWGGPQQFTVKQTFAQGPAVTHALPAGNGPVGDNWHVAVPMTI